MNAISSMLDTGGVEEDVIGDEGLPTGETIIVSAIILRISVTHKTPDEMAEQYGFTAEQTEQLAELLKPEYHSLWNALLYGITTIGDGSMIEVAATQIGNIGGELYWSWYGFTSRVEWCACFVSWVADQAATSTLSLFLNFHLVRLVFSGFRTEGNGRIICTRPAPATSSFSIGNRMGQVTMWV